MNNFDFKDHERFESEDEPIELTKKQKLWRSVLKGVGVVALLALIYLTAIRPIFFYQRTNVNTKQVILESQLNVSEISVPLSVIILGGEPDSASERSEANARNLISKADNIWQQADIKLEIIKLIKLPVDKQGFELFARSPSRFIYESRVYDENSINVFLVRRLGGINGIAFNGINSVVVADYTTVFDFRTLAHEVGHVLGLDHVPGDLGSLMYKGANGTDLTPEEVLEARQNAQEY